MLPSLIARSALLLPRPMMNSSLATGIFWPLKITYKARRPGAAIAGIDALLRGGTGGGSEAARCWAEAARGGGGKPAADGRATGMAGVGTGARDTRGAGGPGSGRPEGPWRSDGIAAAGAGGALVMGSGAPEDGAEPRRLVP